MTGAVDVKLSELVALRHTLEGIEVDRLRRVYELRVLGASMGQLAEALDLTSQGVYAMLYRYERAARLRGDAPEPGWVTADVPAADDLHRDIARRYLELVEAGSRRPTAELAVERSMKRNTMAAHVARARAMGLLPVGVHGRAG